MVSIVAGCRRFLTVPSTPSTNPIRAHHPHPSMMNGCCARIQMMLVAEEIRVQLHLGVPAVSSQIRRTKRKSQAMRTHHRSVTRVNAASGAVPVSQISSRPLQLRCPTQHKDARLPSAHAQAAKVDQKLMVVVDVSRAGMDKAVPSRD